MKKILFTLTAFFLAGNIFSQSCTVTETAPKDTIVCGESVFLTAFGRGQGIAVLTESFNSGTYGPGWSATQQAMWNNPCSPNGVDGTTHIWMGNSSPVPRVLTTTSFNLSNCINAGVTICFDMLFATQGNSAPCEGPDEPQEGVYVQYSIDNGVTWIDINYFDPNGGNDPTLINWNNWCFPIPQAALTSNTKFRWYQDADSGADYDHWGIDNVAIYCNDPSYNIVWTHDGYSAGPVGGTNPTPVAPHVTTRYEVVMSNGTITCRDTVTLVVRNPTIVVNAGSDTTVCNGQCARLNATAKVLVSAAKTPTYTNQEVIAVTGTPGFPGFPPIIPAVAGIAYFTSDINITNLNLSTVPNGYITSVCINSMSLLFTPGMEIFDIWLVCPSGDSIRLVKDSTISGLSLTNTCFVPAGANIATSSSPYTGSFTPNQSFNNLTGCTSNGVWSLRFSAIYYVQVFPSGTFNGWSISFNDPEVSYPGNFVWSPTTNMTNSNTLTPTVCPPPNTYTITVSDTAGCVSLSDNVTVNTQVCCTLSLSASSTNSTCGLNNGTATVNVLAGTGPFTYLWNNQGTTATITNLVPGVYTVTVTGAGGCTQSISTTVTATGGVITLSTSSTGATCGNNNGSATVSVTAGTGPFTYLWSNQGTSATITNLGPGAYNVTVTGTGGCSATASVSVTATSAITLSTSSIGATCGNNNGSASVSVTAGTGPFTYLWNNQGNSATITNIGSGTYTVTVTGLGGCSATASVSVSTTSALALSTSSTDAACGNNNGSATVSVTAGTGPFTYLWSNQGNTATITNLSGGNYQVTVTGLGGCSATASVSVSASAGLTLSMVAGNSPCAANSGFATVNVTSGAGPFTYLWSNLSNSDTIKNLNTGTYSVTVTGLGGCSATASVSVSVGDLTPPIAICRNITVAVGNGIITVAASQIDSGSTDNCGATTLSVQPTTFDCTKLGPHTITLRVTDAAGNFSICNALVVITDTTAPIALCKNPTVVLVGSSATIAVSAIDNGSTDNCGIVSKTISTSSFNCSNLGLNSVTLSVADGAGNSSSCNAIVTVLDTTPPLALCRNKTVILSGNSASITAAEIDNGSTDNCAIISRSVTPDVFDCSNLGTNNVTFTATDTSSNSGSCVAVVTVLDTTPPIALCQDITVSLVGTSASITAADADNGSSDNCAIVSRTVTPDVFDCSNIGANTAIFTATDASGNSSSCNSTVTVLGNLPTAVCQDITVALVGDSVSIAAIDVDGGSSTDCGPLNRVVVPDLFDCSNLGANIVLLTVNDAFGNSSSCNATVTVIDNTPPVALCQDITIPLATTSASITPVDVDNSSSDNCAIVTRTVVPDLFDCSNLGANTATFTAIDASGNSSSCTATITVNDLIPPSAVCQNVSKTLSGSSASVLPTEIDNGSTDNCAIVSRTVTPDLFDCSSIGTNPVIFTATDASGNASSCNATVTISDVTPPLALTKDITVSLIGSSVSITAADIDNSSTDNCTIVSRTVVPDLFTCANLGPNAVSLTVVDQSGNSSSAPATVTIIDDTPPAALCKNFSVTLNNGVASIVPADVDDASTDNCSIVSRTVVPNSFTCTELGDNTVLFTATDQSNNVSSCNAIVTVLGVAPFSCSITSVLAPSNQITGGNSTTIYIGYGPQSTQLSSVVNGQGQYTYSWTPVTGLSCTNCLSPVFTPTAQGNYTFTLTVTSSSGCTSSCSITICVLDIRAGADCNGGGGNGGGNGNGGGKVMVCHLPPGNPNNRQLICIGVAGVPAHVPLHGGDKLGKCDQVCGSSKLEEENIPELITDQNGAGFEMLIYPNPFSDQLHVTVESESSERIDIRLFDVTGKLVIAQNGVQANEDIQMGSELANGVYFMEVQQEGFKKVVRLLKSR